MVILFGDALVGCGALKQLDAVHGEVKSKRVMKPFVGRGVGAMMLNNMIDVSLDRG